MYFIQSRKHENLKQRAQVIDGKLSVHSLQVNPRFSFILLEAFSCLLQLQLLQIIINGIVLNIVDVIITV